MHRKQRQVPMNTVVVAITAEIHEKDRSSITEVTRNTTSAVPRIRQQCGAKREFFNRTCTSESDQLRYNYLKAGTRGGKDHP